METGEVEVELQKAVGGKVEKETRSNYGEEDEAEKETRCRWRRGEAEKEENWKLRPRGGKFQLVAMAQLLAALLLRFDGPRFNPRDGPSLPISHAGNCQCATRQSQAVIGRVRHEPTIRASDLLHWLCGAT